MSLSIECGVQVQLVIFDEEARRMTYYQSQDEFDMKAAYEAKQKAKLPGNIHKFEKFTNKDHSTITSQDFRSIRYKREEKYEDKQKEEEEDFFASLKR